MLELADYAPLPLREPVRSLVWIRGRLHRLLSEAPLTQGTQFGKTILKRLARWEAMTPAGQEAELIRPASPGDSSPDCQ